MSKSTNLTFIGSIRALIADGKQIAFVTQHPEGNPTPLYLIDGESNKMTSIGMPCDGLSVCKLGEHLFVGGSDGVLYSAFAKDKSVTPLKTKIPATATKIIRVGENLIACACGISVELIDAKGKPVQSLAMSDSAQENSICSLASSEDGIWLAIGMMDGTVSVFEREEKDEFVLSESAQIHKGEVTSLLFQPDELRFFSVGADQKLFSTHARGNLEPEDRGRANNHKERVNAMVLAGENRFVTGSADKSCKTWARTGATKPATLSDGIVAVTHLATATIHKRLNLVAAQSDNSIRLFLITDEGKFGQPTQRYNDGFRRAKDLFDSNSPADRGDALHELALNDDLKSLEIIAKRATEDQDNKLRLTAAKLLTKATHVSARQFLEELLSHPDAPVRILALEHLIKSADSNQTKLDLCQTAIKTLHADIGCEAIKIVEKLGNDKSETDGFRNRARELLVESFNSDTVEIRRNAILSLENAYEKNSPRPNLIALKSSQPDARRIGLIRLMQRKLLSESDAGIRLRIEDHDPDVRKTATLLLILSRPKLADALRARDKNIDRQLVDLETFSIEASKKKSKDSSKPAKEKKVEKKAEKKTAKPKSLPKLNLADEDYQPLLIAVSSRAMETCLVGAKCLALLEDPRAFGVLMQLSRESDAAARVEVCKALAALGDPRANERLGSMLTDEAIEVRDAAYTAIESIRDDPLAAAADGLSATAEDVRSRGLETLVKQIRKADVKDTNSPASLLLQRALNDSSTAIRNEAFKVVLNSKVGGGQDKSLRFALTSIHEDVRSEVLTETMAQKKEKWAPQLLNDLLDDPSSKIRTDTFRHLRKDHKNSDIEWLEPVCLAKYKDVRLRACQLLAANKTVAARKILVGLIDDEEPRVRELVLKSLVDTHDVDRLRSALDSKKDEVRLGAAYALAGRGDDSAREVLLETIDTEKPVDEALQERWEVNVTKGFHGLARLGDPSTIDKHLEHLDSENPKIRKAAAQSLHWVTTAESLEKVKPFMQHDDEGVSSRAAFTVAMAGDPVALPAVFSPDSKSLNDNHRLMVAIALGDNSEGRLISLIDQVECGNRNVAMLALLFRDWLLHDGTPRRTIACLAAKDPRTRLLAGRAVEAFSDGKSFAEIINFVVNDRGDEKAWTIADDVIHEVAATMCFGSFKEQGRLTLNLKLLDKEKQKDWNDAWKSFSERYKSEIEAAVAAAKAHKLPKTKSEQNSIDQLAFGTYIGLAREQGRYRQSHNRPGFGSTVISVRCAAVRRLIELSQKEKSFVDSTISVLTQTTGDPNQEVRQLAFEQLAELGVSDERRAEIAIETGHQDLAVAGLELLTKSGKKSEQVKLLTEVVLSRNDSIAIEAAKLLQDKVDIVKLADICFDSPNTKLIYLATKWLADAYDENPKAQKRLREIALEAEEQQARYSAIGTLTSKRDKEAFDVLCNLLVTGDEADRKKFIPTLVKLEDPRVPAFIVEQLKSKPLDSEKLYFEQLRLARDPEVLDDLVELYDPNPKWQGELFKVMKAISGYDQAISDPNDELVDKSYLQSERPRHDDVLAKILDFVGQRGNTSQIKSLIPGARWAKDSAVDEPLARVAIVPEDPVRWSVVEAIGFRAEKRNGPTDTLTQSLEHRDPITKFFAAEGLAKAGDKGGIHVLLAAVDLMDDLTLRRRAVLALGQLGDERSFDRLINLSSEHGHALQDSAAEAIGRIGSSDNKEQILQTLLRLADGEGSASERAQIGLRWLDAPEGWDKLRELATKRNDSTKVIAIQQLGYDDDPASRDLLLKMIQTNKAFAEFALTSAKRSLGEDSIEPEMAWIKTESAGNKPDDSIRVLDRIFEIATPQQILEVLGECSEKFRTDLIKHLLALDPLPVEVAAESVNHSNAVVVEASASIIGRSGNSKHAKSLTKPLAHWLGVGTELDAEMTFKNKYSDEKFNDCESCLKRLIWAAGVLGGNEAKLVDIINGSSTAAFTSIRRAAIDSLLQAEKIPAATIKSLGGLAEDKDAHIRAGVAEIMSKAAKSNIDSLAQQLLPDRIAFNRLAKRQSSEITKTFKSAVSDTHYQPRTLPFLIKSEDVKTLTDVATNGKLQLAARMGAVEGLALIANKAAEKTLASVGNEEANEEELRKAAWRALRRSKRRQVKNG